MKKRHFVFSLAVLLVTLFGFVLWRPWMLPFGIQPLADRSFGQTAGQKDKSFSDLLSADDADFTRALTPRKFLFPADHGAHNDYRTEWWYFTGNLGNPDGRKFGYELTFFRFALSAKSHESKSVWRNNQLYMAHLTLTDVTAGRFYTDERFSRAGNALAGAAPDKYRVWLHNWSATAEKNLDFPLRLRAESGQFAIDLLLNTKKGPIFQGDQGLSRKSDEPGNASYYYSYTRMPTRGSVSIAGVSHSVSGDSWMDREWSTSALSKQQSGWDWFALQFSDNSELMFYRLRRKDSLPDNNSSGSIALQNGAKIALTAQDVAITILDTWRSPHSKIAYPSQWRLSVPDQKIDVTIVPLINDQELNVSYRYWEGAVSFSGNKNGKPVSGRGYVELAGYR